MTLYLILVGWRTVFIETALPVEAPSPEAAQKNQFGSPHPYSDEAA